MASQKDSSVKGLVTGNTGDSVTGTSEAELGATQINITTEAKETDVACEICEQNNTIVKAVNFCVDCNNLNICRDCSKTHRTLEATSTHVLAPIVQKKPENTQLCNRHGKILIHFCQTCNLPACSLCVCLDHGNHTVKKLADTIRSKVEGVKVILEARQNKLKELQQLEKELTLLKAMVSMVDRQEILIKEIEDHAKKCIDEIIKWKEDLKTQVRLDNKIARDIPADLEKVTETVLKLHGVVSRAESLLPNTEHHPEYLNKIESIQKELEAIPRAGAEVEETKHRDKLRKVHQEDHTFRAYQVPVTSVTYGEIDKKTPKDNPSPGETLGVENIVKVVLSVDSQDLYIPCVTAIGDKSYAVAHPTREEEPAKAISIYEYPGTLTQTHSENVPPFRDMAATPDGKLALLSYDEDGARGRITLYDPLTSEVGSTYDIPTARTLSFGVTLRYQYVILEDDDQGKKQIIVMDKNGRQQHKHEIAENQFWYRETKQDTAKRKAEPDMIACGGRFIYVSGGNIVAVYEIEDTVVHRKSTHTEHYNIWNVRAVTASIWDDLFLVDLDLQSNVSTQGLYINRMKKKENKAKWADWQYYRVLHKPSECDQRSKVSTIGGNIVVLSHGHTINVYKVK